MWMTLKTFYFSLGNFSKFAMIILISLPQRCKRYYGPGLPRHSDTFQYEKEKGFAEDPDDGKFSLPMIHLLNNSPDRLMIEHILHQRSRDGGVSPEMKMLVLEKMHEAGSLEFTRETLRSVEKKARETLAILEEQSEIPNYILQYLLVRLSDVRNIVKWFTYNSVEAFVS